MKTHRRTLATTAISIGAVGLFALSGCSGGSDSSAKSSESSSQETTMAEKTEAAPMADAELVGTGCAAYAEANPEGAGSVEGMAKEPVATAAASNPMLTTLVKAVSGELNPDVNLVDTLNGDEFTVIAPIDDAFAKIPAKDLDAVAKDADTLTKVLTYHVIPGQIDPADIPGEHKTVEGATVKIAGNGEGLTFNDAKLVCGGVKTANATVYMIDGVLMPPK